VQRRKVPEVPEVQKRKVLKVQMGMGLMDRAEQKRRRNGVK